MAVIGVGELRYLPVRVVDAHDPANTVVEDGDGVRHVLDNQLLQDHGHPVQPVAPTAAAVATVLTAFSKIRQDRR